MYKFGPLFVEDGRILAITDLDAPNFRIVEVRPIPDQEPEFRNVVPGTSAVIQNWAVSDGKFFVSYFRNLKTEIVIFDLAGNPIGHLPVDIDSTVRLLEGFDDMGELLFEQESFTEPARICRYSPKNGRSICGPSAPFLSTLRISVIEKSGSRQKMESAFRCIWSAAGNVIEAGSHPTS